MCGDAHCVQWVICFQPDQHTLQRHKDLTRVSVVSTERIQKELYSISHANDKPKQGRVFLKECIYTFLYEVKLLSCVQLCDPMDCGLPGSSVHGILQTRILERVAISPGDLPDPGIEPRSPKLQADAF